MGMPDRRSGSSRRMWLLFLPAVLLALLLPAALAANREASALGRCRAERVYLREGGVDVPFLLLTERDDSVLLLREHVIGPLPFSHPDSPSCYYAHSAVDDYLTGEYLSLFDDRVRALMLITPVTITAQASIGVCGEETETIDRRAYLLSWTETTGRYDSTSPQEGQYIGQFRDGELLRATDDVGADAAWWLRTPDTWYWYSVLCVNEDGGIGTRMSLTDTGVQECGVRPAIRFAKDTPVVHRDGRWYIQ